MRWIRALERESAERRIPVWLKLSDSTNSVTLSAMDEHGNQGVASIDLEYMPPKDPQGTTEHTQHELARLGGTLFQAEHLALEWARPRFIPASQLKALRRQAVEQLEVNRAKNYQRPVRGVAVEPPTPYPDDSLSYLANVLNHRAADFYAKHGVKVIESAYEAHEELGDVSLMITKHCVRFSLSLCPMQAKGVQGVQGTVRAEPMTLVNGREKLLLRFDCKPCEMHVVGRMKNSVLKQALSAEQTQPIQFYKTRPTTSV